MVLLGKWKQPLVKPRYKRYQVDASKEDDLTFSFGRDTNMEEVMSLLAFTGCIDIETYYDQLRMVRINNRKKDNGQVLITCPSGESGNWVSKLERFKGKLLKKLHSYSNKEVQVKFSCVHPNLSVKWILNNVLKEFSVKEY